MNWSEAELKFMSEHAHKLSSLVHMKWEYKAWDQKMSMGCLWSYRGMIWKKCTGSYPTPEEVGLDPDHDFFNPDVICSSQWHKRNGDKGPMEFFHHGRKMKPTHRLYPKDA